MHEHDVDATIRRAIGGDQRASDAVLLAAASTDDARLLAVAAILTSRQDLIDRARASASTTRDRQMVAIGATHLAGDAELVRLLARDHLSEHPDSLIVAWIATLAQDGRGQPTCS